MENMLKEMNELRLEKLHNDTEILIEKGKNRGIPRADEQRLRENTLIVEGQLIAEEMCELKIKMDAVGAPALSLCDVVSALYTVEALFTLERPYDAWDALSAAIDSIEDELVRVGK